jgi:hypothetical protein
MSEKCPNCGGDFKFSPCCGRVEGMTKMLAEHVLIAYPCKGDAVETTQRFREEWSRKTDWCIACGTGWDMTARLKLARARVAELETAPLALSDLAEIKRKALLYDEALKTAHATSLADVIEERDRLRADVAEMKAIAGFVRDDSWDSAVREYRASVKDAAPMTDAHLSLVMSNALDPCRICKGTGRNPMSDIVNWLPCSACQR